MSAIQPSPSPRLIDVDCNLWHEDLISFQSEPHDDEKSAFDILQQDAVKESNIVAMLSPSSTLAEAQVGLETLSRTNAMIPIKTTVGVHPYHVDEEGLPTNEKLESIRRLLQENKETVAAVGECGLDTSEGFPPLENQLPWFRAQVELASELNLPLFVHERLAFDETIECLASVQVPVLIHCFTGTREECREYVKRGYFISISGFICRETNDNCAEVQACLAEGLIPLDRLMVETDAPYMGFDGCRDAYMEKNAENVASLNGKKRKRLAKSTYPNLPSSLPQVVDKIMECLNKNRLDCGEELLNRNQVSEQMTRNAIAFFGFEGM